MIYNLSGVPGSGKSLYMVSKIIAELLKIRDLFGNLTPVHIYHNIEGFNNDNMAALLGLQPSIVNCYVHDLANECSPENEIVKTPLDAVRFFYAKPESVKPVYNGKGEIADYEYEVRQVGCVFIIDEAQNFFGSRDFKQTYSKTLIRYISRHRHYHHTIWWATQDNEQVDITFRRQTDRCYYLENLADWGNKNKAKVSIYEGYLGHQIGIPPMSTQKFAYDKRFYCCYKSFVVGGLKEKRVVNNVWLQSKGLRIVAIFLAIVVILIIVNGVPFFGKNKPKMYKREVSEATPPLSSSSEMIPENNGEIRYFQNFYVMNGQTYYVVDGQPEKMKRGYTYVRQNKPRTDETKSSPKFFN